MSVSKSTILLNLPKPVKKAFERVDRREASIRQTPRILKPSAFAVRWIASLSSPSSSGMKVLKSGRISAGAMKTTQSWTSTTTPQQSAQARAPSRPKSQSTAANAAPPISPPRSHCFSRSATNVAGVVRLKP